MDSKTLNKQENQMNQQVKEAMQRLNQWARVLPAAQQSYAAIVAHHLTAESEKHKVEAMNAARDVLRANARRY